MKIYLAARYQRRTEMIATANTLTHLGHTVTSRWLNGHAHEDPALNAQEDLDDIQRADAMILFTDGHPTTSGGRHVETGIALRLSKPIVIIGPKENIFHHLPQIHHCADLDEALEKLSIRPGIFQVTCVCGSRIIVPFTKGICPACHRDIILEHPGPDPRPSKERTVTEKYERH